MTHVAPAHQGRVFAAKALVLQSVSGLFVLLSGPLADRLFQTAFKAPTGIMRRFVLLFDTGDSAGLSPLYVLCALSMALVGLILLGLSPLHLLAISHNEHVDDR